MKNLKITVILSVIFLCTACSSIDDPVVRYYVFDLPKSDVKSNSSQQTIAVDNVKLAQHLNSRSMVQQIDTLQIASSNWNLWAMRPADMLTQTTVMTLQNALSNTQIIKKDDAISGSIDYIIRINLTRFNGGLNNNAVISGRWQLIDDANSAIATKDFYIDSPLDQDGYSALALALQQTYRKMLQQVILAIEQYDG